MAETFKRIHQKQYDRETRNDNYTITYERAYEVTRGSSLADVDLEKDDALPDNASAIIMTGYIDVDKKNGLCNLAHVTAIEYITK